MSNALYQMSSSTTSPVEGMLSDVIIDEDTEHCNDIDLYNEDTFGSGAVEEDWEFDHKQLVELGSSDFKSENLSSGVDIPRSDISKFSGARQHNVHPMLSPSQLNEEELERSNRELAAAVEDLVIKSDQDQDAIDPAIVSLRRQSSQSYGAFAPNSKLFPYYESNKSNLSNGSDLSLLFHRNSASDATNEDLQKIWKSEKQSFDLSKLSSGTLPLNGVPLVSSTVPIPHPTDLQDKAILTAVKDNATSVSGRPLVMKAEDLEREMQNESSIDSISSPLYGISIPKDSENPANSDRSLPARSVSPVFGSPSPSTMPIGTPPKHIIMNMIHQLEQQQKEQQRQQTPVQISGSSGAISRPPMPPVSGLPPNMSVFLNRPPPPFNGPGMPLPPPPNVMWPAGAVGPHMPVNTLIAQDVIHRIGLRMPGSPMRSPIGSPHAFGAIPPRMMAAPNVRRTLIPQGGLHRNVQQRQSHQNMCCSPQRHSQKFGPGHLHPEHSKFVRMRQEKRNGRYDKRGYNNQRLQYRDDTRIGVPGDPYANIMTQKEKDWVIHIQMMALQSDRPEIDDYYYQNYIERRLRDGKLTSHESSRAPQRLITPTKPNVENKKYVPVQFNNSLGKLTTSSVYNPRQIIDVVQASNQEEEESESRQALSKRLVVYKKIEKAYELIVQMEELHASLPTYEDSTERELVDDDLKIKTKHLVEILCFHDMGKEDASKDSIFQIMKIRKGKKLLCRAMPFIPQNDRVAALLSILAHLPILIKRDLKDGVLPELYDSISHTISMVNVDQYLEILTKMSSFNLTAAVRDQVGVSIVCKILDRGRELFSFDDSRDSEEWSNFVAVVSEVMISVANPREGSRHARPSTPFSLLEAFQVDTFDILAQSDVASDHLESLRSSVDCIVANVSTSLGVGDLEVSIT